MVEFLLLRDQQQTNFYQWLSDAEKKATILMHPSQNQEKQQRCHKIVFCDP